MELKETIVLCQAGEKEAFRVLFQSVERKALSTAYLLSGDKGIAEDILQETYIKCFNEIKNLRVPETFNVWFFRILVRTGWEMCRKYSKLIPVECVFDDEKSAENNRSVENIFDESETAITVRNAVNSLNKNMKAVVVLYYYNNLSVEEISKVLGCLKGTVKSRLFYARSILKNQLSKDLMSEDTYTDSGYGKECKIHG